MSSLNEPSRTFDRPCEVCGIPVRSDNKTGVCGRTLACRRERDKRRYPARQAARREYDQALKEAHPLYKTWQGIKRRCFDPRVKEYPNYGGRGVTMFPAWIDSFDAFEAWIISNLGPRPGSKYEYSLDRIDNDGDYRPGNLRWATKREQAKNRRPLIKNAQLVDLLMRIEALEAEIAKMKEAA